MPKGQSHGASGLNQPNPTALQAQHPVLLSCSQARVQSGQSCPSWQREVSTGEEETFQTRTTELSGCTETEPGGDGAAAPLLPAGLGVSSSRYHAGAGLVSPGLVLAHTSQAARVPGLV